MKIYIAVFLSFFIFLLSCTDKKSIEVKELSTPELKEDSVAAEVSEKVGDYLYEDIYSCLHTNLKCINLRRTTDTSIYSSDNIKEVYVPSKRYAVHRIGIENLTFNDVEFCCNYCINDDVYEHLLYLIEKNNVK